MSTGYGNTIQLLKKLALKNAKRKERIEKFKHKTLTKDSTKLTFKKISENELNQIKYRIRKKIKTDCIKNYVLLLFCVLIGLFSYIKLFSILFKNIN